jgi:hypothetical protein
MARIEDNMEKGKIGGSNFQFSNTRLDKLAGASSEYTLVTIAVDETGSISGFEDDLGEMVKAALQGCYRAPTPETLLIRLIGFGSQYSGSNGVNEFFGFKPLNEIDVNDLPTFDGQGMTPLCDAAYSAIGATSELASSLWEEEGCGTNSINFIITDGYDNYSTTTPAKVKETAKQAITSESGLESMLTVLIGINAKNYESELMAFKENAGLDQYIDAGDVTPSMLAKLADFISQSVSSQSQALGTGGASEDISATI